mgnify:CR=1 FL=1
MRADVLAGPSQNEWAAAEARTLPSYHPIGLPSQNEWATAEEIARPLHQPVPRAAKGVPPYGLGNHGTVP